MLKNLFSKKEKEISESYNQFQDLIKENDCKKGKVKVYRIARSDKGYKQRSLLAMDIGISDLTNEDVESWLMETFGGGEYEIKVWKLEDDKSDRVIGSLTYRLDGPPAQNKDMNMSLQELVISQLKDNNPVTLLSQIMPLFTTLLQASLGKGNQNELAELVSALRDLDTIRGSGTPVVSEPSETAAIIGALGNVLSGALGSRNQPQNFVPINPPGQVPSLQSSPQTPQQPNRADTKMNKSKAFEVFMLDPFIAEAKNGQEPSELAGMVESMITNTLYWSPDEMHESIKLLVQGYLSADMKMMSDGFDKLMQFCNVDQPKADAIKKELITIYNQRYNQKFGKVVDGEVSDEQSG